ncbi:DUF4347 domain-containing protein [Phormidesmis priestleyi]|uniref:DUF4347 domain-containing protein n=1 Tax=Phormidesmis priestleyi TaxID=268141 RepID=UPI000932BA3E|nr:DUF4347 domain-containing protein [Phormidesmis priestleyi]
MSFELPRSATSSADVLSTANLTPVLDKASLTTSLTGLGRANQSLLFVDRSVADYQQLVSGVAPGTEVHILDSSQDAVTQITNTLLGRHNISSLHIVSHGEDGGLDFGSSALNLTDLPQYATQLKSWSKALTNDADILLYGCNVAEGELGQAFVQIISQLTEADVAASNNLTGDSTQRGDWTLEYQSGEIETVALAAANYHSVLANFTVMNTSDGGVGSLRDAISQANNLAGADTITFDATTFATAQTIRLQSELVINSDVSITGTGQSNLTINGDANNSGTNDVGDVRALFINSGTVTLQDLAVAGGRAQGGKGGDGYKGGGGGAGLGGGLLVNNGNVTLNRVVFNDNRAIGGQGGAGVISQTYSGGGGGGVSGNGSNTSGGPGASTSKGGNGGTSGNLGGSVGIGALGSGTSGATNGGTGAGGGGGASVPPYNINGNGGNGGFGGGGGGTEYNNGGNGGFGGGGGGGATAAGLGGRFGGHSGAGGFNYGGGGGAGLGGAIFVRAGSLSLNTVTFTNNSAVGGAAGSNFVQPGQGQGGAVFVFDGTPSPNGNNDGIPPTTPTASGTNVSGSGNTAANGGGSPTTNNGFGINFAIVPPNALPSITQSNNALSYTENDLATVLDTTATVTDADSANFDTGTLTVSYSANGTVDDRLAIRNQGTGTGKIGVSVSNVTYGGTIIGTFAGGTGTTPLVITFNASATPTAATALLQNLTYANVSDAPTASRTVQLVITDGDGGTSTAVTKNINVTAVNDAPTISTNTLSLSEGGSVVLSSSNINATDPDNTAAQLTYSATNVTNGRFEFVNAPGTAITSFTQAQINSGAVQFVHDGSDTPPAYSLSLSDGSAVSTPSTVAVPTGGLANVNDAPTLTSNATLTAVSQDTTNPSGSSLTSLFGSLFSDPDTGASLSGLAIVGNTANPSTQGQWQYSINGTTWTNVGAVAEGATALAFSASTLVRFVPVTNYFGTPPGLTVRALDNTYSGGFTTGTTRLTVDTTSKGGTTAISGGTPATLNTSVTESLPSLLWRNGSTGQVAVWQLNGFALQTGYFLPYVVDGSWQISSDSADFNGDGIADILWRHQVTGENVIWEMNNTGLQSGSLIYQVADTNWQIAGTADFNDDGKSDILWRNKASGENAIWQMNGAAIQSADVIYRVADTNWQIAGTADFDGDGKSDILWRNKASGENAIWQMNGAAIQSADVITSLADVNWQIAGVADLGSDRTPDILWRNQQTGKEMIWRMSDSSYAQTYELPDVSDPNWIVKPFVADLETADLLL